MVKNPACNAGDLGLIPGGETSIPHAMRQPSPCATTPEPQLLSPSSSACILQGKIPHAMTKPRHSQINKQYMFVFFFLNHAQTKLFKKKYVLN